MVKTYWRTFSIGKSQVLCFDELPDGTRFAWVVSLPTNELIGRARDVCRGELGCITENMLADYDSKQFFDAGLTALERQVEEGFWEKW